MYMLIWTLIGVGIVAGLMICFFCASAMVCLLSISKSLILIATNSERR